VLAYFDASALVKLVIDEDGSDLAADLWDGADATVASRLALPEVAAALAALLRNHALDRGDHAEAQRLLEELWASVRPVELTKAVATRASQLAQDHGLWGADAVHLASALVLGGADVVMVAWDRRLATAALATGLPVVPAGG
jgi:uncharacterized protein